MDRSAQVFGDSAAKAADTIYYAGLPHERIAA